MGVPAPSFSLFFGCGVREGEWGFAKQSVGTHTGLDAHTLSICISSIRSNWRLQVLRPHPVPGPTRIGRVSGHACNVVAETPGALSAVGAGGCVVMCVWRLLP